MNERLPEKFGRVYQGMKCCGTSGRHRCEACPYRDTALGNTNKTCTQLLHTDSLEIMEAELRRQEMLCAPKTRDKRYDREYYRAHRNEQLAACAERYRRLSEAGICVSCGKKPAREGRVMCEACAQRLKEYKLKCERSKQKTREEIERIRRKP